jgi:hypothetical protein
VEKLSLECGCTHQTISNVERGGGGIRVATLLDIIWAMDCSLATWMEIAELDARLLELLAAPQGWTVIERRYLPMIELAAVTERKKELGHDCANIERYEGHCLAGPHVWRGQAPCPST